MFSLSIMCSSRGLMRNHSRGLMRKHLELTWSIIFELQYSRINDKIILRVLKHIHLSLSWTMVTLFLHSFSITTGQHQNIVKRFIFKMIQFWSSVCSGLLIAEIFVYRRVFFYLPGHFNEQCIVTEMSVMFCCMWITSILTIQWIIRTLIGCFDTIKEKRFIDTAVVITNWLIADEGQPKCWHCGRRL